MSNTSAEAFMASSPLCGQVCGEVPDSSGVVLTRARGTQDVSAIANILGESQSCGLSSSAAEMTQAPMNMTRAQRVTASMKHLSLYCCIRELPLSQLSLPKHMARLPCEEHVKALVESITELRYAESSNLMTVVERRRGEEVEVCIVDGRHRVLALIQCMRLGRIGKRSRRGGLRGEMVLRVNVLQGECVHGLVGEDFDVFLLDLSTALNSATSTTRRTSTADMLHSIISEFRTNRLFRHIPPRQWAMAKNMAVMVTELMSTKRLGGYMESHVKRHARAAAMFAADKQCYDFYRETLQSSRGGVLERANWDVIFLARNEMTHARTKELRLLRMSCVHKYMIVHRRQVPQTRGKPHLKRIMAYVDAMYGILEVLCSTQVVNVGVKELLAMKPFDGEEEDRSVRDAIVLRTPEVKGVGAGVGVGYLDIDEDVESGSAKLEKLKDEIYQSCVKKMCEEGDVEPGSIPRASTALHSPHSVGREREAGGATPAAAACKETGSVAMETQSGGNTGVNGKAGEVVVEETQSGDEQHEERRAGDVGEAEEIAEACDGNVEGGGGGKSAGVEVFAIVCERAGYTRRTEGTLAGAGGSMLENAEAQVLKGSRATVSGGSEVSPRSPQSGSKRARLEKPGGGEPAPRHTLSSAKKSRMLDSGRGARAPGGMIPRRRRADRNQRTPKTSMSCQGWKG